MNHTHTPDVDWAAVVDDLDRSAAVNRPTNEQVVAWLTSPPGAPVADVGCGAGGMTVLLAEAVGPRGRVVAMDGEPALLAATAQRCGHAGVGDRVSTVQHDVAEGALPVERLDLLWAAGVVHHIPDQQAAVDRLAAALASAGRLALAEGGLASRCLPWDLGVGRPGLESRLGAAEEAWFADMRADLAGARRTPYGWASVLTAAGLTDVTARSFLLDRPAPLDAGTRTHVVDSLAVRVERVGDRLGADDRDAWERLLDPDRPDHLGRRDDLHLLAATTVHVGTRP